MEYATENMENAFARTKLGDDDRRGEARARP